MLDLTASKTRERMRKGPKAGRRNMKLSYIKKLQENFDKDKEVINQLEFLGYKIYSKFNATEIAEKMGFKLEDGTPKYQAFSRSLSRLAKYGLLRAVPVFNKRGTEIGKYYEMVVNIQDFMPYMNSFSKKG